ncbi:MAG: plastocyanin/azurin family copper-binding protein [Bacteroidota bacterium]
MVALLVAGCATDPDPLSPEEDAVFTEAVDAELVVVATRNAMAFETTRVEAPAGATVRLVMDNTTTTSPAMIHNVVVLTDDSEETADRVSTERPDPETGIPDDPAILAYTPLAGPGERLAVVFTMPPPGSYTFLCTYPGHARFMRGVLVSLPPSEAEASSSEADAPDADPA